MVYSGKAFARLSTGLAGADVAAQMARYPRDSLFLPSLELVPDEFLSLRAPGAQPAKKTRLSALVFMRQPNQCFVVASALQPACHFQEKAAQYQLALSLDVF